jgi:hypothetical protein
VATKKDRRDKPGDDEVGEISFTAVIPAKAGIQLSACPISEAGPRLSPG